MTHPVIHLTPGLSAKPEARAIAALLQRQVLERTGISLDIRPPAAAETRLELGLDPDIGREGFRLEDGPSGSVCILGQDIRGLLYGVGKFLRTSQFGENSFTPGTWRGESAPVCKLRGMYLATHFHNFYHDAPVEAVERYVEEVALWGINTLCVWFDKHHYTGIQDPKAKAMLDRLRLILRAAKRIGLKTALLTLANEAYADSPAAMRAEWAVQNGYSREPRGHFHLELCPHKSGGLRQILEWHDEVFSHFADAGIDYLCIWPYDQGGCTCQYCAPWGGKGFLHVAEKTAELFRQHVPKGQIILSTWYFDRFTSGEWQGLADAWTNRPPWADLLLADDSGKKFPEFPIKNGVPGDCPLVNFPEISMWGTGGYGPWGGFGASPFPRHVQECWVQHRHLVTGGFPYSEGIFEDINKAVCAGFYWNPNGDALETVREYVTYEFGPSVVEPVMRAISILEDNLKRSRDERDGVVRFVMANTDRADEAFEAMQEADRTLPPGVRNSWRWRILFLRALIDAQLVQHDFTISEDCEQALEELTRIYHAENAAAAVAPPTRRALQARRSTAGTL